MRKPAFARPGRRSSVRRWRWLWRSASPLPRTSATATSPPAATSESTDDAYVKADSTIISPKVSGYIAQVLVGDNQPVKAGQLLARIDDRDFRTALEQARADVAASEAAVRNLDAQIALQQPIIEQGTADVAAAEANLKFAQEEQRPLRRSDEDRLRHHPARPADRRGAARKDRAGAARPVRPARRASGRSTFSPPTAPRPWRSSITPAPSRSRRR